MNQRDLEHYRTLARAVIDGTKRPSERLAAICLALVGEVERLNRLESAKAFKEAAENTRIPDFLRGLTK